MLLVGRARLEGSRPGPMAMGTDFGLGRLACLEDAHRSPPLSGKGKGTMIVKNPSRRPLPSRGGASAVGQTSRRLA